MLITPDLIEDQAIAVLNDHHEEHLAALERDRGLPPRKIEKLATIDLLAGEGFRLREDNPPAALLGLFGISDAPVRDKSGALTLTWTLAVQITVVGTNRRDTMKRRGWYALTVAQCLLAWLPRKAEPVDTLALADIDFTNGTAEIEKKQRSVGEAQLLFDVKVRDALSVTPPYDPTRPPGSPGGPPADPYDPPVPFPTVSSATTSTTKEPL